MKTSTVHNEICECDLVSKFYAKKVGISAWHAQKLASSQCVSWSAQNLFLGPCLTTFARTLKSHLGMRNDTHEMELFTFFQQEMPTYQNRKRFSKQFEISREKNHCQPCKLHFPQAQSSCLQYFQNIFASKLSTLEKVK